MIEYAKRWTDELYDIIDHHATRKVLHKWANWLDVKPKYDCVIDAAYTNGLWTYATTCREDEESTELCNINLIAVWAVSKICAVNKHIAESIVVRYILDDALFMGYNIDEVYKVPDKCTLYEELVEDYCLPSYDEPRLRIANLIPKEQNPVRYVDDNDEYRRYCDIFRVRV